MLIFLCIPAVIILDQMVKYYIQKNMFLNESIPIINNILHITYIRNKGAAFGIFSAMPEVFRIPFFIVIGAVFILFIILYFKKILAQNNFIKFIFSLIIGGAIGNLTDRIRFGEVIDFIEIGISEKYKWPVFNLADSCISTGVVLLLLYMIKHKEIF